MAPINSTGDSPCTVVSGKPRKRRTERRRTTSESDSVPFRASPERRREDREKVILEDADFVENPSDCPIVVLLVHAPEPLQVLQTACRRGRDTDESRFGSETSAKQSLLTDNLVTEAVSRVDLAILVEELFETTEG